MKNKSMAYAIMFTIIIGFCLSGCTAAVFHNPKIISTKSINPPNMKKIKTVSTESNMLFIFFPFPSPSDPRDIWDNLLKEAVNAGGNAVVDVQFRSENGFLWLFPLIGKGNCVATGTAVKIE